MKLNCQVLLGVLTEPTTSLKKYLKMKYYQKKNNYI
jgi:hypothetical protein